MRFPGRRLLQQWDLGTRKVSLGDLVRSCQQVSLTGFAEVSFQDSAALIFYYQGLEVNALYREGPVAYHGKDALDRLGSHVDVENGVVSIYELPLDMAHLLRGITNRQRVREPMRGKAALTEYLHGLEKAEHTGTLEINVGQGGAMVLLVRGRISNIYWESAEGITVEQAVARRTLENALEHDEGHAFLASFSRDAFMGRHEVQRAVESRLVKREAEATAASATSDQLAALDQVRRMEALEELAAHLPSVLRTIVFDLLTGLVLTQRGVSGAAEVSPAAAALAESLPALVLEVRQRLETADDAVELVEISTNRLTALVGVVRVVNEGIGVITDRAQPRTMIATALTRAVLAYEESLQIPRKT